MEMLWRNENPLLDDVPMTFLSHMFFSPLAGQIARGHRFNRGPPSPGCFCHQRYAIWDRISYFEADGAGENPKKHPALQDNPVGLNAEEMHTVQIP